MFPGAVRYPETGSGQCNTHSCRIKTEHSLQEESPPAGVHVMLVDPLIFPTLAVKGALLETAQLQGEAGPQLLQAGHHRLLPLFRLLLKNVAVVSASAACSKQSNALLCLTMAVPASTLEELRDPTSLCFKHLTSPKHPLKGTPARGKRLQNTRGAMRV